MCVYCLSMHLHDYASMVKTLLSVPAGRDSNWQSVYDLKSLYYTCPVTALYVCFLLFNLHSSSSTGTQTALPTVHTDTLWIKYWTLQMIACYDDERHCHCAMNNWLAQIQNPLAHKHQTATTITDHLPELTSAVPCSHWLYKLPIDNSMFVCAPVSNRGTLAEQKQLMMFITILALERKQVIRCPAWLAGLGFAPHAWEATSRLMRLNMWLLLSKEC